MARIFTPIIFIPLILLVCRNESVITQSNYSLKDDFPQFSCQSSSTSLSSIIFISDNITARVLIYASYLWFRSYKIKKHRLSYLQIYSNKIKQECNVLGRYDLVKYDLSLNILVFCIGFKKLLTPA